MEPLLPVGTGNRAVNKINHLSLYGAFIPGGRGVIDQSKLWCQAVTGLGGGGQTAC